MTESIDALRKAEWQPAQEQLGVEVIIPFDLKLDDIVTLHADVLVKNFGHINGMLIFHNCDDMWPYRDDIISQGYGYTCYDVSGRDERDTAEHLADFIDMLSDWGWAGDPLKKPAWVKAIPEMDEESE